MNHKTHAINHCRYLFHAAIMTAVSFLSLSCLSPTGESQLASAPAAEQVLENQPNILWICVEDQSPWFGCYGNTINAGLTPNIDELASSGVLFERCFVPAPVCSPCRSALITGAMQTSLGLHNHRSSRTDIAPIHLPEHVQTLPELMQQAGYFTFNRGKDDYNFTYNPSDLYTGKRHWRERAEGQPFFGQIQLRGGKHSYGIARNGNPLEVPTNPDATEVPPYFPDIPEMRHEFAIHHDTCRITDQEIEDILNELEADSLLDNTVIFFFTDHGMNNSLRHKQFCYEGGVHVPLIIYAPKNYRTFDVGERRTDLVSGIDISASTLAFAGIDPPIWHEGQDLFSANHTPRKFVISARDRCDYTIDHIRTVRTENYRYIRNYMIDRPWLQPQYRDRQANVKLLRQMAADGLLEDLPGGFFSDTRPPEELYDINADPHQVNNLANDPEFQDILLQHRDILTKWIYESGDQGQYPESLNGLQEVYNQWEHHCVNPEYDRIKAQATEE